MSLDIEDLLVFDETEEADSPIVAHIVDPDGDKREPSVIVLDAMVNGKSLKALCGHIWIPSRNPDNYPICKKCLDVFDAMIKLGLT